MLDDALEIVRGLASEALEAREVKPAGQLSRLACTMERAIGHQRQIEADYIPIEKAHAVVRNMVNTLCHAAEPVLPGELYMVFEAIVENAAPKPVPPNPEIETLRRECNQVERLFALAMEAKQASDAIRLGNLLCLRSKLLLQAEISAGLLIGEADLERIQAPIVAANKKAREAIGDDFHDQIIEAVMAERQHTSCP